MFEDTPEKQFFEEENNPNTQNIVRGEEILPYIQNLEESHNPTKGAIAIRIPAAMKDFDIIYDIEDDYGASERYEYNGDNETSIDYFIGLEEGEKKLKKIIRETSYKKDGNVEASEEVVGASDDDVKNYFSKYTLQNTSDGNVILYGGEEFTDYTDEQMGEIAEDIDRIHKDVQREMGIRGRSTLFLYRSSKSMNEHAIYGSSHYIDSNIESKESRAEVVVQLARSYIEDYDLVNETRSKITMSPVLVKLNSRIERYKRLDHLGAPQSIINDEVDLINKALGELARGSSSKLLGAIFDSKTPSFNELESNNFNLKKFESMRFQLERVEMPYIFREGLARFVGLKTTGGNLDYSIKSALNSLGGYSSDIEEYYENVPTEDYANFVMPSFLWHLFDHFGLSAHDLILAVSKTSHKDFSFDTFFKNLDIDSREAIESWNKEMQRNLPKQ